MTAKTHATMRMMSGQLPDVLAEKLGLDSKVDSSMLVNITLDVISKPTHKKHSSEELRDIMNRMQQYANPATKLTDEDLYDQNGIPK